MVDPDPVMVCDLMEGRDSFLTMARERRLEFSSLRRTKYSTMVMLYELHTQGSTGFVYKCNACRMHMETRYHCSECEVCLWCICTSIYVLYESKDPPGSTQNIAIKEHHSEIVLVYLTYAPISN